MQKVFNGVDYKPFGDLSPYNLEQYKEFLDSLPFLQRFYGVTFLINSSWESTSLVNRLTNSSAYIKQCTNILGGTGRFPCDLVAYSVIEDRLVMDTIIFARVDDDLASLTEMIKAELEKEYNSIGEGIPQFEISNSFASEYKLSPIKNNLPIILCMHCLVHDETPGYYQDYSLKDKKVYLDAKFKKLSIQEWLIDEMLLGL